MTIAVVDYGAGNLRSVETALAHLSAEFDVVDRPETLESADKLIIPGVGDARAAMNRLDAAGMSEAIRAFYRSGRPVMGICLGSQIVLDGSDEGDAACLGLAPGRAREFSSDMDLKVPHMGWNTVHQVRSEPILKGVPDGASFYFVHSYYPDPDLEVDVLTTTEYGRTFASSIVHENLVAFQFHPEKSGRHGLQILSNFVERG